MLPDRFLSGRLLQKKMSFLFALINKFIYQAAWLCSGADAPLRACMDSRKQGQQAALPFHMPKGFLKISQN